MDVHKESIDVAIADAAEARHYGRVGGDAHSVDRLTEKLRSSHRRLTLVYEAGPCGFCDRRDAMRLARLARAGELEAIHVPDARDEALRDLVRAREDAVIVQRQVRQRLQALLLRHEIRYVGRTAWTQAHRRWIAKVKLPNPAQQIAFEEYVQAVHEAAQRLERLNTAILAELEHWRWRPVVEALQALRGVQVLHAVRIVAELGDFQRFESPRKLMAYLGLIPSELASADNAHCSRERKWKGCSRCSKGRNG
jgi:transposase